MSHIPQAKTGLKPPSKVHKPVQGGGGSATSPTNSSTGVVRPRGNPAQRPVSTPGAIKTSPSSKSTTGSGVVRPRGSASNAGLVSPRGSVHATSGQQMVPKLSRENSQTRLQYRREGSNVSLPSTGSDSSEPVVRRRGSSSSQQGATSAADLKKFFKIGDRVLVSGTKPGVIGFIGETKFAKGDWAGVMLDEPTGKNDGSVAGVRYFDCEPLHGVFTKLEKMTKINKVNVTHHSEGSTTALEIGDRVVVSGTKIGTVRYVGITGFAKGDWAGVELDEPLGKNDGAVAGTRYFQCQQDFGLFAPIHKVIKTGKKESTKLPFSPPPPPPEKEPPLSIPNQLKESLLNSVSESIQNQAKSESSVSSPESIPLSASSTLTNAGPKNEAESQDRPDVNPGKAPAHVSLQLVALQEALQEREREIQALLEERDFERNEVASATSQVSKAEEELVNIKKKHEEAVTDNAKRIQELKNLIDLAEKEKADLYLQVEEEKRKNEDLQFKLEEEEIILGDELKTEEEQIKDLTQKLQEKEDKVNKLTEELEQSKAGRSSTAIKLKEKEHELLESKEQLSSLQVSLEESQNKVQQLEAKVSLMEEKHTADSSQASQGMKEHLEKIKQLENVLNISNEKEKRCQTTIENTKYELKISQEENDSLRVQIEDLSAKLISKENEFDVMSDELKQIKLATLELQKQLQISEAKTMNLTSDKKKMECEIAEIMKNSGNNSERLTYLNEQLREKDRMLDELKGASAESHIHIERLTKDVAEAKECHSKDLEKLSKSHDEQTKKLINQINSLKTEVEKHKDANHSLVQTHKQELEKVEQIKSLESSSLTSRINQQTEQLQQISQDLSKTKNELQAVMQDRDKTKEVNNAKQTEVNTYKAELNKSKLLLDNFAKELEETKLQLQSTAQDRDSVKESEMRSQTEVISLQTKLEEKDTLQERTNMELITVKSQQQKIIKERDILKEKCCQYEIEIEAKQNEISQVTLKLDAAVSEKGLLTRTQGETEKKISEVMEKYEKLNSDYQAVLLEKNEKIKICEENENKVKTLYLEKETILQDKHNTRTKLDELQAKYNMLKKETDTIKAQSAQQEEELTLLRSSASDKLSEMTKLQSQMNQVTAERDQFKRKVVVLEEQGNLFQDKVKSLEQEKTLIQSQKNQVAEALAKAQHEVISLNARLHERPTSLASEISNIGLENDLEAIKHELKIKDEEIVKCKQQVLDVKKQMVAGATQDTADLAVKLTETEDLLEATTAEKENLDAQRKNEENEQRIELLMLGETRSANGLLESPEMDEAPIPRYKVRLFCDICDVFDEHDTDDCPAQASEAPDVGSMHHGSRTEARPYCITCEVFGHWTEDCDDEETF